MHGLVLCNKVNIYVGHMLYAWPFSHNKVGPISIKKNKSLPYLNTHTTIFAWGAGNYNKKLNVTIRYINMI